MLNLNVEGGTPGLWRLVGCGGNGGKVTNFELSAPLPPGIFLPGRFYQFLGPLQPMKGFVGAYIICPCNRVHTHTHIYIYI